MKVVFMIRWLITLIIAVCACTALPSSGRAGQYALVIGVSGYNPKIIPPLNGPANDVRLVWDLLIDKGFKAGNISLLADKMAPGKSRPAKTIMPTRQNIFAEFKKLVSVLKARKNEKHFVFIYFSGHGSQQPQFELTDDVEPDNFDEVFLPLDTGKIDPFTRKIRNGLTDDEIKALLSSVKSTGNTFVWAVFDACHSGDMVRGIAQGVQSKFVPPESLVPDEMREQWSKAVAKLMRKRRAGSVSHTRGGSSGKLKQTSSWLYSNPDKVSAMTVFSAVSEDKLALEMPIKEALNSIYSIFTYHLVKAMRQAPLPSYRALAAQINRLHAGYATDLPSPVFEGELDRALSMIGGGGGKRQWPITVSSDRRHLMIGAGTLFGVTPGAILKVSSGAEQSIAGYVQVVAADAASARAQPVPYGGQAAMDFTQIKRPLTSIVVSRAIKLRLRVAVQATTNPHAKAIFTALRQPNRSGEKLPFDWVAESDGADVFLVADAKQIFVIPGTSSVARQKRMARTFGVSIKSDVAQVVADLRDDLWKILRRKNLLQIAATLPRSILDDKLEIRLFHVKGAEKGGAQTDRYTCPAPDMEKISSDGTLVTAVETPVVRHCDILRLEVSNSGKKSIQVAGLLLGPDASIRHFDVGNRPVIKPGQTLAATSFIQITTWCAAAKCKKLGLSKGEQPTGLERLLLLAFELDDGVSPRSLAYLAQPSLTRAVKARSEVTRSNAASPLEAMLRQAALIPPTRGITMSGGKNSSIGLLQWNIVR